MKKLENPPSPVGAGGAVKTLMDYENTEKKIKNQTKMKIEWIKIIK